MNVTDVKVQHDEKQRKFYADIDGKEAAIEYAKMGDVYNLSHTFVPEELRGQGIAEKLARGTLDEIGRQGARFLPTCPYIQAFVRKHPEYQEAVAHYDE